MRTDIVETARGWLGTKFHYAGRVKINIMNNGGIDCIGLVMKIGEEINSKFLNKNIIYYDYLDYSRYPNHSEMKTFLDKYFISIQKEDLEIGDLIYFNFKNNLEHIAVYVPYNSIIHCSSSSKRVVEEKLTSFWNEKIIGFYRYP